jgi:hypothetical protein
MIAKAKHPCQRYSTLNLTQTRSMVSDCLFFIHFFYLLQVVDSTINPSVLLTNEGGVAQLVRVPDCRSGGCGFEPRRSRHFLQHTQVPFSIRMV